MIEVGAQVPDFSLPSHLGAAVAPAALRGEKWLVLHAFPLAFTGG